MVVRSGLGREQHETTLLGYPGERPTQPELREEWSNEMKIRQSAPAACRECGAPSPTYDTRDVVVRRRGLQTTVPRISGWFCVNPACSEIEFDESTDSMKRWVAAGDDLVLAARERSRAIGTRLREARQRLQLSQIEAAMLAGGGHNAFSRYETGTAPPVAAVTTLFALLASHPELLPEARSYAEQMQDFRQGENEAELPEIPVSRQKGGMHAAIDPTSNRSMFDAADDRGAY